MLKVGLTGGLASGKSFVGETLKELGCRLIQADVLGHEVILPGGEAYAAVVEEFGPGVVHADGTIDRKKLAGEVFGNPTRLARLNELVHPPVFRREQEWIARYAGEDPHAIIVVEAAIMIEAGSYRRYDCVVLAVCTEEQQVERAMRRDGASRESVEARIRSQMPLSEKRKYADYVIDTSDSKEHTRGQVTALFELLKERENHLP